MKRLAILGQGVTAKSVQAKCEFLGYELVAVESADLIVASPGLHPKYYPETNVPIISEIEFAYLELKKRGTLPNLVAVTGTNGKSTVTAMIAHVLNCPFAGNIGVPFIDFVENPPSTLVLELSSFQLETCYSFCADVAVLLNISLDHLSRHATLNQYIEAKCRLFQSMSSEQTIVFNEFDELVKQAVHSFSVKKHPFSLKSLPKNFSYHLPGRHNLLNVAATLTACLELGVSVSECLSRLESFKGLPHRLEFICKKNEVSYYNDSKATNLDSTLRAVEAFSTPIHLILCGQNKPDVSDSEIALFLKTTHQQVKEIYVYGGVSDRYQNQAKGLNSISFYANLNDCLSVIEKVALQGEIVLFSPSSSSYDLYNSFEHRGDVFKRSVLA